jgi:precorrin-4/cobalt-precorrin-4 C11-methyltransferase
MRDFRDSALYDPAKPHVLRPVVGVDLVEDHNI